MFTIFQNKNILLGPARNLKNRIWNVSTLCPLQLIQRSYCIFILVKLNFSSVITITILALLYSVTTFCFVSFFLVLLSMIVWEKTLSGHSLCCFSLKAIGFLIFSKEENDGEGFFNQTWTYNQYIS